LKNGTRLVNVFPTTWSTSLKPDGLLLAFVFVLYFVGAKLGVMLTVMPEGMAIIWLPNCVVLAALVRFKGARYPLIACLALAAEVAADWPQFTLLESVLFGLVNVGEATIAFVLLSRWKFDYKFSSLSDLWKFVVAGPIVGALTAALFGAAIYSGFRGTETAYLEFVRIWWFGDGLGLLILTPLLLGFRPFAAEAPSTPLVMRPIDMPVLVAAALSLALFWVSSHGEFFKFPVSQVLILPFLIFAAARYPQRWVAAAVAVATLALTSAMTMGKTPFGALAPREAVIRAQEFIFIMSLVALGLAALLSQLRARQDELQKINAVLRRSKDHLETRVMERTRELTQANEQLAALASVDPLTELYNRRGLFSVAQREFALARRNGRSLAVVVIDLDHFKSVNDRYGHLVGDETLKRCALVLKECSRLSDCCARFGGEEFVLVAPETDLRGALGFAERIHRALRDRPMSWRDGTFHITASIGVTVLGAKDSSVMDLLQRADNALYQAKSGGRDRIIELAPAKERG
jgi:diguanylate cyclase (GGDEF)-like protein